MLKNTFTQVHKLSSATPNSLKACRISVPDLIESICDFLGATFRDAVEIEVIEPEGTLGYLVICSEYFAYFFKLLLTFSRKTDVLHIKLYCDERSNFTIHIEGSAFENMTASELCKLMKVARETGFSPYECPDGLVLKRMYKLQHTMPLYAPRERSLVHVFKRIFFSEGE